MTGPATHRDIRFGIMCNGMRFQAWQAECLRKLMALDGVEPALIIIDAGAARHGGIRRYLRKLKSLRRLLWFVYRALGGLVSRAMKTVDMAPDLRGVPGMHCTVRLKGKFSQYFSEDDVAAIREHDLDFIIRFGFNIIRGDILDAPRYGVWSFHHDDEEKYRGGPPAFWEVYTGDNVTGAILQRLTDRLDSGIVLKKGYFKTNKISYVRNRDAAFFDSTEWPAQVCLDIQHGNTEHLEREPSKTEAPIFRAPTNGQMLVFAFKMFRNIVMGLANTLFVADTWNVGIADQPIAAFLGDGPKPRVRWLPAPARHRFSADPFAIRTEDVVHVFFEDFDYRTSKGYISAIRLFARAHSVTETAIEEPFHLSYPNVFTHEGAFYCIPESCEANQVILYRADNFPGGWTRVATLIDGFAGVDGTILRHDGRWWLFATDQNDGHNYKLTVWHAPELTGPWTPHVLNPVKMDIRSARPAGTPFVHEGSLYRPAQDCSAIYGGSVTINRVVKLTPHEFEEEIADVVEPYEYGPYPDGVHTISAAENVTVVDGMKKVFIGHHQSMIAHKLRRLRKLS
jgi:hypothetical protein